MAVLEEVLRLAGLGLVLVSLHSPGWQQGGPAWSRAMMGLWGLGLLYGRP